MMRRGIRMTLSSCCAVVAMVASGAGPAGATPGSLAGQRAAGVARQAGSGSAQWNLNGANSIDIGYDGTSLVYSVTFTQAGSALSGTLNDPYYPTSGPVAGTVSGDSVNFTFSYPSGSIQGTRTYTGTISSSGAISGTWTQTGDESPDNGTWALENNAVGGSSSSSGSGPDLAVSATTSLVPAPRGKLPVSETDTYEATVANIGKQTATGVVLSITVPSGFRIGQATAPGADKCSTSGSSDHKGGFVSCALGSITSGDSVKVSVDLVPNAAGASPIQATATEAESDANPANNSFSLPFSSCQIEVLATHIGGLIGPILPAYHTFIVYTAADGTKTGFRGGPTYGTPFFPGNIRAGSGPYNSSFVDWSPGAPSATAMVGSRACGKNSSFQASIGVINDLRVPYRAYGPNSNTVTSTLLKDADVALVKPDLYTPGWNESL